MVREQSGRPAGRCGGGVPATSEAATARTDRTGDQGVFDASRVFGYTLDMVALLSEAAARDGRSAHPGAASVPGLAEGRGDFRQARGARCTRLATAPGLLSGRGGFRSARRSPNREPDSPYEH